MAFISISVVFGAGALEFASKSVEGISIMTSPIVCVSVSERESALEGLERNAFSLSIKNGVFGIWVSRGGLGTLFKAWGCLGLGMLKWS